MPNGPENDLLIAFEVHDPERIRLAIASGADPNQLINGKLPLDHLIEMYLRSSRFPACLQTLIECGATSDDPLLLALLTDDCDALKAQLGEALVRRFSMPCAFTALVEAEALHLCAEYGSIGCANLLIEAGADINARAGHDELGRGGQSPIFHVVNSVLNHGAPMLDVLVGAGADLDLRCTAIAWGSGFDWETTLFEVTPLSYAQCGLLPQFHRDPEAIYGAIDLIYRRKYGQPAPVSNVPNRYLG